MKKKLIKVAMFMLLLTFTMSCGKKQKDVQSDQTHIDAAVVADVSKRINEKFPYDNEPEYDADISALRKDKANNFENYKVWIDNKESPLSLVPYETTETLTDEEQEQSAHIIYLSPYCPHCIDFVDNQLKDMLDPVKHNIYILTSFDITIEDMYIDLKDKVSDYAIKANTLIDKIKKVDSNAVIYIDVDSVIQEQFDVSRAPAILK